jgi:DSP-PTPase phosphatase fused to NAD+ Kinase
MIKLRFSSLVFLAVYSLCLFCSQNSAQSVQEAPPIRNFLQVNEQFCTGGQPRLEHLAKLKADGVKSIINLRQPSEHRAPEEEAEAKKLGLRYFNIPVVYGEPKDEQADEFLKITDDP